VVGHNPSRLTLTDVLQRNRFSCGTSAEAIERWVLHPKGAMLHRELRSAGRLASLLVHKASDLVILAYPCMETVEMSACQQLSSWITCDRRSLKHPALNRFSPCHPPLPLCSAQSGRHLQLLACCDSQNDVTQQSLSSVSLRTGAYLRHSTPLHRLSHSR
jgi:hypothetical protein